MSGRYVPGPSLPRRGFLTAAAAGAAAGIVAACGGKGKDGEIRIAWLSSPDLGYFYPALPFFEALANADLPRASRVVSDVRLATNQFAELDRIAAEVVAAKPNVIVAHFPGTLDAASNATDTTSIVSIQAEDPARQGLLEDLHDARRNVTGVGDPGPVVYGKRVELLKEAFPAIRQIAVFIGAGPGFGLDQIPAWAAIQEASSRLGLAVDAVRVDNPTPEDRGAALARVRAMRPDALLSVNTGGVRGFGNFGMYELPFQLRVPAAFDVTLGLIDYWPDQNEVYQKAAEFVVRILKGAQPADIPVHTPKMRLTVNAAGARQIGLTVAPSVLAKADQVIQ